MNYLISVFRYLSTLMDFLQGFLVYRILFHFAQKRSGKFWSFTVYLSCAVIANMVIFPTDLFNVTLVFIWFTALMLLAFQGGIWQKLAAVAVLYPLIVSLNFLTMDMLGKLGTFLGWSDLTDLLFIIADSCLSVSVWYGIYRVFEKHLNQMGKLFDDKIWMLLDAICLASMVSITTCIYFSPEKSYKMWPAALACFATNLGCIVLAIYFTTSIRQNMERKNLMLQKSYYEELEQNQDRIRKLRHDMNNHLIVIKSLFQSGNQEEAERYMKELETQMTTYTRVFCKNSIANAVLNAKYNLALEHGIDCFFHIDLEKLTGIDAISLCCLFSNTLDNAIEASLKIPDPSERRISVKARVAENGYFSYEIINAKINAVSGQGNRLKSDKEGNSDHGLGLSNVREMVDKYSGTLDISYTEDTFTVTVLIGNS